MLLKRNATASPVELLQARPLGLRLQAVLAGCMRPRATLTSGPLCTALHAALLPAWVQTLASTKSLLLSYLLLQNLPPFIECQPKSVLFPSQPPP